MTDYRKWDNFGKDLSDSDDDTLENDPMVTKLDAPKSISIGPTGSSIVEKETFIHKSSLQSLDHVLKVDTDSQMMDLENFTENGSLTENFYWSQSRQEVVIRCQISEVIKANEIICDYNSNDATKFDGDRPHLQFSTKSGHILLSGSLRYDIIINPSDKDVLESAVDWEIKNITFANHEKMRILEVTLKKKSPMPGVTMWWNCVFVGDSEIDVTKIKGRGEIPNRDIWEEAHRLFKEKVAQKELIDTGASNDETDS